jgi:serine protease inhibitor
LAASAASHLSMSRLLPMFAALALLAPACGDADTPATAGGDVLIADVARAEPDEGPMGETVAGMHQFTHDLYTAFATPDENAVFSPLSIAMAFGMARAGAAGQTAEEIDAVLGFHDDVHPALGSLEQLLVTTDGPPPVPDRDTPREPGDPPQPPVVAIANGLFAQDGLTVKDRFLETLAHNYGVGVRIVDFRQPDEAKATIDAWVAEQTAERIEELFEELDTNTKLVLANAVYLKADWQMPFVRNPIVPEPFTRIDGSTVEAQMMSQLETLSYAAGDGWQAVELGYAESDLAMWVIVPDEVTDPAPLLAPATLDQVAADLEPATVDLSLPQWDFATDLDLVELLEVLGMTAPFGPADFSGITDDADLFIDQAVHKANITVDEWGTEAAAVTGLAFPSSGPPEPEAVVRADRPFAFVIRHLPTGAPLFAGHVADPTVE